MKSAFAQRPVFVSGEDPVRPVSAYTLRFQWYPGCSLAQKRRCIDSLHDRVRADLTGVERIMEVSRSSVDRAGRALSAFNLALQVPDAGRVTVECAYQCAKVFHSGGPFPEWLGLPPDTVRRRLAGHSATSFQGFHLLGRDWPTEPDTLFYDWLYARALLENPELMEKALAFQAYSDIAFNPRRSRACQARALARAVSLHRGGILKRALRSPDSFAELGFPDRQPSRQAELPL